MNAQIHIRKKSKNACIQQYDAYRQGYFEYCEQYNNNYKKEVQRRRLAITAALAIINLQKPQKHRRRRHWIVPFLKQRNECGAFNVTIPRLLESDVIFHNYCRMSKTSFDELLLLVGPRIQKKRYIREPICPQERLLLTLRYLATGDSMMSMKYQYYIAQPTISNIILETCKALWEVLSSILLAEPTLAEWEEIARDFENKCQFPHCIGAVDGKHVVIQAPPNSGSTYYNYKGSHSIVLMAVCDSNYRFRIVDIGAPGRQSDGGIWNKSAIGQKLATGKMDIPPPSLICNGHPVLPYVFIGDEAFQLTEYMMRPFPGRGLTKEKRVFNYRLSRARRIVECSFGILSSQWRIYRRAINTSIERALKIVQATISLHNWLRRNNNDNLVEEIDLDQLEETALLNITNIGSNTNTRAAGQIRDQFMRYFNTDGAVPWQNNI